MWLVIRTSDGKVRHQTQSHVDKPEEQFRQAVEDHRQDGCKLTRIHKHLWTCVTAAGVETTIALEPDTTRRAPA